MSVSFRVLWTRTAEADLEGIVRHIAGDDVAAALDVLKKIRAAVNGLARFPERARVVPELKKQGIASYRELIVSPWRIMFRIAGTDVFVLSVIDGRMNVEDVLLQRFLSE